MATFIRPPEALLDALDALGIGDARNTVRRVVIDLQVGNVPIIHVEHIGDERIIEVFRALGGVDVRHVLSDERLAEANRVATDYLEEHRLKGPAGEFLD